jgi:hypothetical protein
MKLVTNVTLLFYNRKTQFRDCRHEIWTRLTDNERCYADAFSVEIFAVIYSRHRSLQSETKICIDIGILILRSRMFTPTIPSIYVDFALCIVDL